MRAYVAGPMSGYPRKNHSAFYEVAAYLESWGFVVENPARNKRQRSWEAYMKEAIPQMLSCEAVFMLPGWRQSRGARLEHHVASELGLTISYL